MKDVQEAQKFIHDTLGTKAAAHFATAVDDLFCSVKSKAIFEPYDMDAKFKFEAVANGMIADAVKIFVGDNYVSPDGRLEIHVTETEFLDKAMMPVTEITAIRSRSREIVRMMVELAMQEYERGQAIAYEVNQRVRLFEEKFVGPQPPPKEEKPPVAQRKDPPLEVYEIEMMRLERRLPFLSNDEGNRLSQLYALLKITAKTH